ncbi:hypothetical protein OQA88_13167 [Cercophora sp. LCS_1]
MGRWAHLDTDQERLPEGMTRIAYDADTQIYTFRDVDGSLWESAPGVKYGVLHRVKATPKLPAFEGEIVEGEEPAYVLHDADLEDDHHKGKTFEELWNNSGKETPALPEKAYLRRYSSVSKKARKFLPKSALPLVDALDVQVAALADKDRERSTPTSFDEKEIITPITPADPEKAASATEESPPPLPPRRQPSSPTSLAKGVKEGVKQMFSDKSEFRGHRG